MGKVKRISKSGGITIPAELRRDYDFEGGEAVDIQLGTNGELVIRKYRKRCLFCQDTNNIVHHQGRSICKKCIERLGELAHE